MGRLIFVGLGLAPGDLTDSARDAIENADAVVAEFYTSRIVGLDPKEVAQRLGRPVRFLTRKEVEEDSEAILEAAGEGTVCFITGGDALTATTHNDLRFQAKKRGIETQVVHGVSIQTAAAGEVGLHSYKFGRTTTIARPYGDYLPESPYEVIAANLERGLHTLVLLDLDAENESFMTVDEGAQLLLTMADKRGDGVLSEDTAAVGCARIGSSSRTIRAASLGELATADLGPPLHSLIVPGELHFTEEEALDQWRSAPSTDA